MSLFGNNAAKPAATSLFGGTNIGTQNQQQQPQQQNTGSLFGGLTSQAQNQQASTGLFGAQQSQQQQQPTGFLPVPIVQSTGSVLNKTGNGLLGVPTIPTQQGQQQPQQIGSIIGGSRVWNEGDPTPRMNFRSFFLEHVG
jgi:hypothetical protein